MYKLTFASGSKKNPYIDVLISPTKDDLKISILLQLMPSASPLHKQHAADPTINNVLNDHAL